MKSIDVWGGIGWVKIRNNTGQKDEKPSKFMFRDFILFIYLFFFEFCVYIYIYMFKKFALLLK